MAIVDLSFSNPRISEYFARKPGAPAPAAELLFIHENLLGETGRSDFMSQLEVFIATTDHILSQNPKKRGVADKITKHAIAIGRLLTGDFNLASAEAILPELREVHELCSRVNGFKLTDPVHPGVGERL